MELKVSNISRRGFLRAAGITLFTSIAVPKLILPDQTGMGSLLGSSRDAVWAASYPLGPGGIVLIEGNMYRVGQVTRTDASTVVAKLLSFDPSHETKYPLAVLKTLEGSVFRATVTGVDLPALYKNA